MWLANSNVNSCLCSWVVPLKSCGWYVSIAEKQAMYDCKVKWMNCILVQIFVEWGHKTLNSHYWLAVQHCTLQTGTVSLKPQRSCLPQHFVITKSVKADSHIACRAHAIPLPCRAADGLECVFPVWFTQSGRVWFCCLAMPMPCSNHAILKATAQHSHWETACGLPARVQLLPATTWSSTKIVIRSIPILLTTIHTYNCKQW